MISDGSKNFEKKEGGGGRRIFQLRPHLSQMRKTKYMPLHGKNGFLKKKHEPILGPTAPTL